jgi:hypothetical protein
MLRTALSSLRDRAASRLAGSRFNRFRGREEVSAFFWWFGLIHAAAYIVIGSVVGLTWLAVECWGRILHRRRLLVAIINWTLAKNRWRERHKRGLSDAEWKRGEPQPHHFPPADARESGEAETPNG